MNTVTRTCLLALVPSLMLWSATTPETTKTEEKKLPEIVTKTRAANDEKNLKNYQTFKTNWIKNETERLKALNDALKSATQKGDFDTCLAIKEEITGVESLITMLNDPACKMVSYEFKDNKPGENVNIKPVNYIGKYQAEKFILSIMEKGKALNVTTGENGKWILENNKLIVFWDKGWQHSVDQNYNCEFKGPDKQTGNFKYILIK